MCICEKQNDPLCLYYHTSGHITSKANRSQESEIIATVINFYISAVVKTSADLLRLNTVEGITRGFGVSGCSRGAEK